MYEYKYIKVNVDEKEEEINKKLDNYGKEGWELINFQASNDEPWTTIFIFVFKKKA